jgi:DNA-binding transcriptional ArsR family regulator
MREGPNVARVAALIGDHTRAEVLTTLMTGQALTASELAAHTAVTKQTISSHLAMLVEAKLIAVTNQGRHRYFRLADDDVAQLLESLMGVAYRTGAVRVRSSPREPALRKARACYDHLAGELGVLVLDSAVKKRLLTSLDGALEITRRGRQFFQDFGIDIDTLEDERRPLCRACLDWSVRRHHLAGTLGAAILTRCIDLRWAHREKTSRAVTFSSHGEAALRARFN